MWPKTVSRRLRVHLAVGVLVALSAAIQVGCGDRETILSIENATEVYGINQISSESSGALFEPGKVIAVLNAGDTVKAIGVYHGKDYDAFHVKLADGTEGLIVAGDTFTATSR